VDEELRNGGVRVVPVQHADKGTPLQELARGTVGRANDLQLLVNQQARTTTGAFRTTSLGALSMESGLRPAGNQLENRQRRFGLRLLSLPRGERARKVVGARIELGNRLASALSYTWTETEATVLLEEPETFDAELIQEEREEAKKEADKARPGLTMFTDGSRLEDGAAGYAVSWKNGQTWKGIKTHMGYNQEAFDAECAALARALESASRRNTIPDQITIFTDARAEILLQYLTRSALSRVESRHIRVFRLFTFPAFLSKTRQYTQDFTVPSNFHHNLDRL